MAEATTQDGINAVTKIPPTVPVAKPKAEVPAKLVKAGMKKPIESQQKAVDALQDHGSNIATQFQGLRDQLRAQNKPIDARLAEMEKNQPQEPSAEFKPIPPKDASVFFSMMMVCAALGGRSTLAPMTAAMNNMSGIMKAQNDNNTEMLAAQKEQFKMNFDAGMAKMKSFYDRYDKLLKEKNYNMGEVKEEADLLFKEYGVDEKVYKSYEMQTKTLLDAMEKTQRMNDTLMEQERRLSEQAYKNLTDPEEKRKARAEKMEDQRLAEAAKIITADAKLSGEEKIAKINALYSGKPAAKGGGQSNDPMGLGIP